MNLNYYFINTILGKLTVIEKNNVVVYIGLPEYSFESIQNWCNNQFGVSKFQFIENTKTKLKFQLEEYFEKKRTHFDLNYELFTTNFRTKVLNEVSKIPFGQTKSYSEIAEKIKNPKAVRAVGSANATNTLPIIIPCHRVISRNGGLGGYGGGLDMKIKLLELEGWNN